MEIGGRLRGRGVAWLCRGRAGAWDASPDLPFLWETESRPPPLLLCSMHYVIGRTECRYGDANALHHTEKKQRGEGKKWKLPAALLGVQVKCTTQFPHQQKRKRA